MIDINQIPTIAFYGDEQAHQAQDLLHVEPLITRSRKHRFKIKPHRHHHLTQFFVVETGSGQVRLDGQAYDFSAPCVIVIAAMCVHDFTWATDISGTVLTCNDTFLEQAKPKDVAQLPTNTGIIRSPEQLQQLTSLLQMLSHEYQHPHIPLRNSAVEAIIRLLLTWLARQLDYSPQSDHAKRKQPLLSRYQALIDEHYTDHLAVADYAHMLNVTPPHLNAMCRRHADTNALQIIHQRVMLEAKRTLTYTVLTVNQVSDSLGFQDPGYFNRFFKRHTGTTPKQYRNSH